MAKILVIDDKKDNLTSISVLLKTVIPGCDVLTAQSGSEGIKMTKAKLPDTILLDIKMPEMDGFEVCAQLKSIEEIKHIPIIMITAIQKDSKSMVKGLELGADTFLTKPIDESELAAQVKVTLRIKKAEDLLRQEKDLLEHLVEERTKSLRESEKYNRMLFENSPIGLALCRMNGELIDVNSAYVCIIGRTVEETFKLSYWDITPEKYAGDEQFQLKSLSSTGRYGPYEKEYIHKDGHLVPVRLSGMILEKDGEPFIWSSVEDITYQEKAKEEKANLESRLRQAQKMEALGTLAGGIAHDFNNILFPIVGYSEMCMQLVEPESVIRNNLAEVLKASQRADGLVKQILAFSRQTEQERKPVQVKLILKEVLKFLKVSLPSTIAIRQNLLSESAVLADPVELHQVMMNLCTNAYHAMRMEGGVLEVTLEEIQIGTDDVIENFDPEPDPYIKLEVSDSGCGMSKAVMDRIFEPYFTTKEQTEGTGLGLAVVHGIIKDLKGHILVSSEVNKGTTFTIYIPRIEDSADIIEDLSLEPIPTGNEHVLLVDDEGQICRMVQQMLEQLGYQVTIYTDSVEALTAFKARPQGFDVLITDMTMPGFTGLELTRQAKAVRPEIPVVLMTGYSDLITEKKAQALGIHEFVMKPVLMRNMAETIRRALDQSRKD